MIRTSLLVVGLALFAPAVPAFATASADVPVLNALEAACAAQAASAFEPGFESIGRPIAQLDLAATVDACWAAMGTGENDFRMNAWMSRAYYAAGQYEDAFYFADRAAQNDVPLGLYVAGVLYTTGQGVAADPNKGADLLMQAVAAGFTPAFHALALNLINGLGVEEDVALAVDFLRLAADEGFGPSATMLGYMYFDGNRLPKDDAEASRLMRLGAHNGDAEAYAVLGRFAEVGIAGPVDMVAAAQNYTTAVDLGYGEALLPLARLYLSGRGVDKDVGVARQLLSRAAEQGDGEARVLLKRLGQG